MLIVPEVIFVAFNAVSPVPLPDILVADKVLVVLSQARLALCRTAAVPFPIRSCPLVKVAAPVPPLATVTALDKLAGFNTVNPVVTPVPP